MSAYDPYDVPPREPHASRRYMYREDRRDGREPRYVDTQETYARVPSSRTDLVSRPREDSDYSIEEVRRDFPPPGYAGSRDVRRARSVEPGHDDYYDARRDYDGRSMRESHRPAKKPGSVYYEEEERARKRVVNQQEKIIAALVGGVLAAGAKEVWDRREAKENRLVEPERNLAASAAIAAGGALAGYQGAEYYGKHTGREEKRSTYIVHKGRDGRVAEYYSDDEDDVGSRKNHKGNKSFLENALSAAGLGSAIKALTGGNDRDRYDDRRFETRSRRGSFESGRSDHDGANKLQKAAKASLVAGAAEAFRVAREPGGWKGEKVKRILTAAAGAATIDAAMDPSKDSKRHLVESVIGGLLGNRVLNGSRKEIEEDRRTGRSRSRSRARSDAGGGGGLAALATAGLGALAGKKLLDRGSRSRSRGRRDSFDSYDSRDASLPPKRSRSRSRSVVDGARRSLAKLGIGSGPKSDHDDYDDSARRPQRSRGIDDRYDDDLASTRGSARGRAHDDYYDDDRSTTRGGGSRRSRSRGGRSGSVSSSDLGDSEEDEKQAKKMKGKQVITTGLATVATIHAAHNVYSSMEKRNARHKAVKEGRLSPAEAKKLKSKALLQDAASVGIAALGIKGALSELKEARELAHECHEWQEEKEKRHQKRLQRLKQLKYAPQERSQSRGDDSAPPSGRRSYDDYDHDQGPRYQDANPYSSLPAPSSYHDRRRGVE